MSSCLSESVRAWFNGPLIHLCSVYVLYYWGENMWMFALGLYLVHFEDGILRLVAIFGFASAGSIFLFGGMLGQWVDRTTRLKVMKVAIFVQDCAVILLSGLVFCVLRFEDDVKVTWSGSLWKLLVAVIITLSIIAQLFGMVFKISLERDWFVVIASGSSTLLARINSVTRTLDQICMILAPLVAGQIMTYVSLQMSALIIAGYSLVTVIIKYILIFAIYKQLPELSRKKASNYQDERDIKMSLKNGDMRDEQWSTEDNKEINMKNKDAEDLPDESPVVHSCPQSFCSGLLALCKGWAVYAKQRVLLSGMGLAFLYMTVLGFHNVTVGYAYANGIRESVVGILAGLAGVAGILGSLVYPVLRTRLGLERTGLLGFWFEISCLTLPLMSIWLPGSPFEPGYMRSDHVTTETCLGAASGLASDAHDVTVNRSEVGNTMSNGTASVDCKVTTATPSIIVFLIGVILSRIGLWIADLTVAQLMQENVAESERGVVNGVQNSLNMLFEITKYILVMILPYVQTYGILIVLSYGFVLTGALLFLGFVCKNHKEVLPCCHGNKSRDNTRKLVLNTSAV